MNSHYLMNGPHRKLTGLWDDLMLAAAAFGILDEVTEQLAQVYPNYQVGNVYIHDSSDPFYAISHFCPSITTTIRAVGGGGSSSSSGGGDFGGSSGGGGFR